MTPVVSFVGRSNCGKTTYLEKLVREMKLRGHKVAVIKHDVHGFEIDKPGKDTWRHAQAGADMVCISSPQKMALIQVVAKELTLAEVLAHIKGMDIIFTEGYKYEDKPKIEVFRQAAGYTPLCNSSDLLALVTDTELYKDVPQFNLQEPAALADFLEEGIMQEWQEKINE